MQTGKYSRIKMVFGERADEEPEKTNARVWTESVSTSLLTFQESRWLAGIVSNAM